MSTDLNKPHDASPESAPAAPVSGVSRRALLSGAGRAAVPAIITLYSGAALAKSSSNLISADSTPGAEGGKYRCLNVQGLDKQGSKYDLGKPPLGQVTRIQSSPTYYKKGGPGQPAWQAVTKPEMCSSGGEFYLKNGSTYTKVKVNYSYNTANKGVLVSSTALNSFSSGISYTDV